MAAIRGNVLQTDNLVTRTIFISASNNTYPSTGTVLISDGEGNTFWSSVAVYSRPSYNIIKTDSTTYDARSVVNTFNILSGSGIGQVASPIGTNGITIFSKGIQGIGTYDGKTINAFTEDYLNPTLYLSSAKDSIDINPLVGSNTILFSMSSYNSVYTSTNNLVLMSTVSGLGTYGYLSSLFGDPVVINLSTSISISASTISTILRPSIESNVTSSINGLGTIGYISSVGLFLVVSTTTSIGLSTVYSSIIGSVIPSTVQGLGTVGFFSDIRGFSNTSTNLTLSLSTVFSTLSTTQGIFSYQTFPSSLKGLGSYGYTSTLSDFSSIKTSTIRFQDYTTREEHRVFTSSSRLYFNSTIVTGSPTLALQFFVI
jgi:hypothetical protein